jgi:hypothetical protein
MELFSSYTALSGLSSAAKQTAGPGQEVEDKMHLFAVFILVKTIKIKLFHLSFPASPACYKPLQSFPS